MRVFLAACKGEFCDFKNKQNKLRGFLAFFSEGRIKPTPPPLGTNRVKNAKQEEKKETINSKV